MSNSRIMSVSFNTLLEKSFSSAINAEETYPGLLKDIVKSIGAISEYILDRELIISMPKLEEIVIDGIDMSVPSDNLEDGSIGEEFKKYLSLLNQFNNYVGQGMEEALIDLLNSLKYKILWYPENLWRDLNRLKFMRNSVQFPDIHLVDTENNTILLSIEAKTWFLFARDDLTARFHIAPLYIHKDTLIVIFPWVMDKLMAGSPLIFEPYVCNARELAELRDKTWRAGGSRELKRGTPINPDRVRSTEANHIFINRLNNHNIKSAGYQLKIANGLPVWEIETDNFGKIWRKYDDRINEAFKKKAMSNTLLGKTIETWRKEIRI